MSLTWMAQRLEMGGWTYVFNLLGEKPYRACVNIQGVFRPGVFVCAWVLLLVFGPPAKAGTTDRPVFKFHEYLIARLRVHLLSASNAPAIQTTLTETDIARILKKINRIWSQAGVCFWLESLVREEAAHQEIGSLLGKPNDLAVMLKLRPETTQATNLFNLYYVKEFSANGVYLGAAMFVKDAATLLAAPGGIDEPLPRVSSHELGHALSLRHHTNALHLLASRTTGTNLDLAEIRQAREAAAKIPWIETAPSLLKRADDLQRAGKSDDARKLYQMLGPIPLDGSPLDRVRKRATDSSPHGGYPL